MLEELLSMTLMALSLFPYHKIWSSLVPSSIARVETLAAMRKALDFLSEIGISLAVLEGDSKIIIKYLKDANYSLANY